MLVSNDPVPRIRLLGWPRTRSRSQVVTATTNPRSHLPYLGRLPPARAPAISSRIRAADILPGSTRQLSDACTILACHSARTPCCSRLPRTRSVGTVACRTRAAPRVGRDIFFTLFQQLCRTFSDRGCAGKHAILRVLGKYSCNTGAEYDVTPRNQNQIFEVGVRHKV